MEEFNGLSDTVFYRPSPGIVCNQQFQIGIQIIGNQESRLGMAVLSDNDLSNHALVVAQRDRGFMNQGVGELSFGMRDMNTFPRGHLIKPGDWADSNSIVSARKCHAIPTAHVESGGSSWIRKLSEIC